MSNRFAFVGDGVMVDLHAVAKAEIGYRGPYIVFTLHSANGFVLHESCMRFETEGSNSRRIMTNEQVEQQMHTWHRWMVETFAPSSNRVNRRHET